MSVENSFTIINLFIVPLISSYFFVKRNGFKLSFNFEVICIYSIFVVLNSIIVKGICSILRQFFSITIEVASSYYTIIALVIALLTAVLFEIFRKYITVVIEEKNEK